MFYVVNLKSKIIKPMKYYKGRAQTMTIQSIFRSAFRKLFRAFSLPLEKWKAKRLPSQISNQDLLESIPDVQTTEEYLLHMASRNKPVFFISEKEFFIKEAERRYSNDALKCIEKAQNYLRHIFDLLGSGPQKLGARIDWHIEIKAGEFWNRNDYFRDVIKQKRYNRTMDIRVTWELNRFLHLPSLGRAAWYVSFVDENGLEKKLAEEFVEEIDSWVEQNPMYFGVNWISVMDLAIRLVNWIWGYYFFKDSPYISNQFWLDFFKNMLRYGRYLREHLEWTEIRDNHYIADITALFYLGVLFPEFKEAEEWKSFAFDELINEMEHQVYPDGVQHECTTNYHRLVLECFLSATILGMKNGIEFPVAYMERLEKMVEFVMFYTRPDGKAPVIGDMDNGRLYILGNQDIRDHRHVLSTGAVLFRRPDFKKAAGEFHEEAFWLLGVDGARNYDDLPEHSEPIESKSFPEGGFHILRDKTAYAIIRCGPFGLRGYGGHSHCDQLSFELFQGEPIIIDPGIYAYNPLPEERNLFHSTAYHNTVVVDKIDQRRLWATTPPPRYPKQEVKKDSVVLQWEIDESKKVFEGEHYFYTRLKQPVIHRRKITFWKQKRNWVIEDFLDGEGEHQLHWYFHFGDNIEVRVENECVRFSGKKAQGTLIADASFDIQPTVSEGWVAPSYGIRNKAAVVQYTCKAKIPVSIKFVMQVCCKP